MFINDSDQQIIESAQVGQIVYLPKAQRRVEIVSKSPLKSHLNVRFVDMSQRDVAKFLPKHINKEQEISAFNSLLNASCKNLDVEYVQAEFKKQFPGETVEEQILAFYNTTSLWPSESRGLALIGPIYQQLQEALKKIDERTAIFTIGKWFALNGTTLKMRDVFMPLLPLEFSEAVSHIPEVTLFNCGLVALPSNFSKMTSLKWLNLNNNDLRYLPDLSGHEPLGSLRCDNNPLQCFPILNPNKIETVSIGGTKISMLPDTDHTALRNLSIDGTNIYSLPNWLLRSHALEQLDCMNLYKHGISTEDFDHLLEKSTCFVKLIANTIPDLPVDSRIFSNK